MSNMELLSKLGLDSNYATGVGKALEHSSYSHEKDGGRGNERMEFLGDAVLGLVVSEYLYRKHLDWNEGRLSRARSSLVNNKSLAQKARELGLGSFIRLGLTEVKSGGEDKDRILANVFESVVAAVYLEGGYVEAKRLCENVFSEELHNTELGVTRDAKTELNEWAHSLGSSVPKYSTLEERQEEGEDRFLVAIDLEGRRLAEARGKSKRSAESAAAAIALREREIVK